MRQFIQWLALASAVSLAACKSPTPTYDDPVSNVEDFGNESDPVDQRSKLWVTTQYADRFTCASAKCGIVGRYMFREAVTPFERSGAWLRVSKYYDASCANGKSEYVDKGRGDCTPANGIRDGRFGEWVEASRLSSIRPDDPAESATEAEKVIAQSDDFAQHREAFLTATDKLIREGRCTAAEFAEMGGWAKSSNDRDRPVYFTYCGGMTKANRLYLNVATGEVYR